MYPGRSEPAAFIASPVFNRQGLIIGFVALELGNQQVFRVFNDYSGLGATGETMVVMRNGEELTFVAPPRNEPDAAFKYRVRIGSEKATAMQKAVQGQRGYGEAIDYRGKPVVAAWSYLPSYRWGMVVKQDVDEAFALVYKQRLVVAFLLAATVLAVSAVALWLARTITRPIREAALVTDRVASGDLTVTCNGQAPGEAGLVASGHPQDDPGPSLTDRQDSALEHHAFVDRHRDRRDFPSARAGGLRLQCLDQPGRGCRQPDLGHQPGTLEDDERG